MATAKYLPMRLTTLGRRLLAKVQTGQGNIQITRFAAGSGVYEAGEDYGARKELKDKKQEYPIASMSIQTDDSVVLEVTITNYSEAAGGLAEGYKIREMAFYAMDPDEGEICYCIMVGLDDLQMDYIPAYDGLIPASITNYFYIKVANADTVQIDLSSGERVNSQEGVGGFRIFNGKMQYVNSRGFWTDVDTDASCMTVNSFLEPEEEFPELEPHDSLEVLFGKIQKYLEGMKDFIDHAGRVILGAADTPLEVNDTLFIIEGSGVPVTVAFEGAAYTNMIFAAEAPNGSTENWGQTESDQAVQASVVSEEAEDGQPSIIEGKLVVSEEAASDATFFAQITN